MVRQVTGKSPASQSVFEYKKTEVMGMCVIIEIHHKVVVCVCVSGTCLDTELDFIKRSFLVTVKTAMSHL